MDNLQQYFDYALQLVKEAGQVCTIILINFQWLNVKKYYYILGSATSKGHHYRN